MASVRIRETVVLPREAGAAYDFFTSPAAYKMFRGFGPIPGIDEVVWESGEAATLGAIGRVHNSDGSTHRERVVAAERGRVYTLEIDEISSAFRHMVSTIHEEARFEAKGFTGIETELTRTFRFEAKSVLLLPVLRGVSSFFRAAVRKNHAAFLEHLRTQL